MEAALSKFPHRRYNPLSGEYVLVSPHRTKRPWLGQVEKSPQIVLPAYDPGCYLCPGNSRAGGVQNPVYANTFVFTNDFAALLPEKIEPTSSSHPALFQRREVQGTCRVVCFSPRHDLTLARMEVHEIIHVINVWADQVIDLQNEYAWIQVFENRGAIMGASNPHPHGQIWALSELPNEPLKEDRCQREYYSAQSRPLLLDYAETELELGERIIASNTDWVVLVPYWAVWPFETLILPRRQVNHLPDLSRRERLNLADILKNLLIRYDNLFETSFPYSMGWHGCPRIPEAQKSGAWQLHAHFYPPLLRSATVKKFMVGFEMLGEPQRDITAEMAAERLRNLPTIHYLGRG